MATERTPTPPPLPRRLPADVEELALLAVAGRKAERRRAYRPNADGKAADCEKVGELMARMLCGDEGRGGGT